MLIDQKSDWILALAVL